MKLLNVNIDEAQKTTSNFAFSTQAMEDLQDSDEYTLANVVVDCSGSTSGFTADLEKMLNTIFDALKKSPRSENLLLRTSKFDTSIEEIHGFVKLADVDPVSYAGQVNPRGMTALFDATGAGLETIEAYVDQLDKFEFMTNGILVVVTDGWENASGQYRSAGQLKDKKADLVRSEKLESIQTILIGVGNESSVKVGLEQYADDADFDQFVWCGDATPQKLAKIAGFVSQSISSQSQALGTGGPSVPLTF